MKPGMSLQVDSCDSMHGAVRVRIAADVTIDGIVVEKDGQLDSARKGMEFLAVNELSSDDPWWHSTFILPLDKESNLRFYAKHGDLRIGPTDAIQAKPASVPSAPELISWTGSLNNITVCFSVPDPVGVDVAVEAVHLEFRIDSWTSMWQPISQIESAELFKCENCDWRLEVAKLERNTAYRVRARGLNCVGDGDPAYFDIRTSGPPFAGQATQISRLPGIAVLSVTLTPDPTSTVGGDAFTVEKWGTFMWEAADSTTTWNKADGRYELSVHVSGPTPVRVWTENALGRSATAYELQVAPSTVPEAPTILVTRKTPDRIATSWSGEAPEGTTLMTVEGQVCVDSHFAAWEAWTSETEARNLLSQTDYLLRARVKNEVGWSGWCEPVKARTSDTAVPPSRVEVIAPSLTSVSLRLLYDEIEDPEAPTISVSAELASNVFLSGVPGVATPAVVIGDHRTLEVRDLEMDTEYALRIWTHNAVGRSLVPCICTVATARKPEIVTDITVVCESPHEVEVQCNIADPAGAPILKCVIEHSTSYSMWTHTRAKPHPIHMGRWIGTVTRLDANSPYLFRVHASNACGLSPVCTVIEQQTKDLPAAPVNCAQLVLVPDSAVRCMVEEPALPHLRVENFVVEALRIPRSVIDIAEKWEAVISECTERSTTERIITIKNLTDYSNAAGKCRVRIVSVNNAGWRSHPHDMTLQTMTKPWTARNIVCVKETPYGVRVEWEVDGVDFAPCDTCEVEIARASVFSAWGKAVAYSSPRPASLSFIPLQGVGVPAGRRFDRVSDGLLLMPQPRKKSGRRRNGTTLSSRSLSRSNSMGSDCSQSSSSSAPPPSPVYHSAVSTRLNSSESIDASRTNATPAKTEKWRTDVSRLGADCSYTLRVGMRNAMGIGLFSIPIAIHTSTRPPAPSRISAGTQSLHWVVDPEPSGAPVRGCLVRTPERTYFGYRVDGMWEAEVPAGTYEVSITAYNCVEFGPAKTERVSVLEDSFPLASTTILFQMAKACMKEIAAKHDTGSPGNTPASPSDSDQDEAPTRRHKKSWPWTRGDGCSLLEFLARGRLDADTLFSAVEDVLEAELDMSELWQSMLLGDSGDSRLHQEFTDQHKYWVVRWNNLCTYVIPRVIMSFERLLYGEAPQDHHLTPVVECLLEQSSRLRVANKVARAQELAQSTTAGRVQQTVVSLLVGILIPLPGMVELWAVSTTLLWLDDRRYCVLALDHRAADIGQDSEPALASVPDAASDPDATSAPNSASIRDAESPRSILDGASATLPAAAADVSWALAGTKEERLAAWQQLEQDPTSVVVCNCGLRTVTIEVCEDDRVIGTGMITSLVEAHPLGNTVARWTGIGRSQNSQLVPGALAVIPSAEGKSLRIRTMERSLGTIPTVQERRIVSLIRLDTCIRVLPAEGFTVLNKAWGSVTATVRPATFLSSPVLTLEVPPGDEVPLEIDFSNGNMVVELKLRGKKEEIDVMQGQGRCFRVDGFM